MIRVGPHSPNTRVGARQRDARAPQIALQRSDLRHWRHLRQGHQNDPGVGGILEPHQGRDHATRTVVENQNHLPVIGALRIHQQQRMPGGRGVEHDEGAARFADDARERVEHRDPFGARRAQVLQKQGSLLCVETG